MDYTINLNSVIVIEALDEGEPQTGTLLYNDLIKEFENKLNGFDGKTKVVKCNCKADFINAFRFLPQYVTNGLKPIIHIECHGNEEGTGFILPSNEIVLWKEIYSDLKKANISMKNSLFITMGVCNGGNLQEIVNVDSEAPFFCLIGSNNTIYPDEIFQGFSDFYKTILFEKDIVKAIQEIKKNPNFKAWSAEKFFNFFANVFEEDKKNGQIDNLANDGISRMILQKNLVVSKSEKKKLIEQHKVDLIKLMEQEINKKRDVFFMVDKYPELKSRFSYYEK